MKDIIDCLRIQMIYRLSMRRIISAHLTTLFSFNKWHFPQKNASNMPAKYFPFVESHSLKQKNNLLFSFAHFAWWEEQNKTKQKQIKKISAENWNDLKKKKVSHCQQSKLDAMTTTTRPIPRTFARYGNWHCNQFRYVVNHHRLKFLLFISNVKYQVNWSYLNYSKIQKMPSYSTVVNLQFTNGKQKKQLKPLFGTIIAHGSF